MNTKRVTKAGSISIPVGLRREQNIHSGDAMDIEISSSGRIILNPHNPRCVFCSSTEDVKLYMGKGICSTCISAAGREA